MAPDAEFLPRRSAIEGGYRGIEGFERWIADTDETFETFEQHYELIDLGERVVAWGNVHVRARGSGIETNIPAGAVLEFRDGKIVEMGGLWLEGEGARSRGSDGVARSPRSRGAGGVGEVLQAPGAVPVTTAPVASGPAAERSVLSRWTTDESQGGWR